MKNFKRFIRKVKLKRARRKLLKKLKHDKVIDLNEYRKAGLK